MDFDPMKYFQRLFTVIVLCLTLYAQVKSACGDCLRRVNVCVCLFVHLDRLMQLPTCACLQS